MEYVGGWAFREVRKIEALDRRSLIGMRLAGRTTSIDIQYRDFGRYTIGYLGIQDSEYSTDTEEAIMRRANLHRAREQKVDKRLTISGIAAKDAGAQRRMAELLETPPPSSKKRDTGVQYTKENQT